MRLTDSFDVAGHCKVQDYRHQESLFRPRKVPPVYSYGSFKSSRCCEVSFSLGEVENIIPWALDNYIEVKAWHPDVAEEWQGVLGKPLGYVWTKKGEQENLLIGEQRAKFRKKPSPSTVVGAV